MPLVDAYGRVIPLRARPGRKPKPKVKRKVGPQVLQTLSDHQNISIVLRARHTINGEQYGPGKVIVPRKVANGLLEADGRAAHADDRFKGTRACVIGPGKSKGSLGVREVPPEFFDLPELTMVPFGVVDRGTAQFHAN